MGSRLSRCLRGALQLLKEGFSVSETEKKLAIDAKFALERKLRKEAPGDAVEKRHFQIRMAFHAKQLWSGALKPPDQLGEKRAASGKIFRAHRILSWSRKKNRLSCGIFQCAFRHGERQREIAKRERNWVWIFPFSGDLLFLLAPYYCLFLPLFLQTWIRKKTIIPWLFSLKVRKDKEVRLQNRNFFHSEQTLMQSFYCQQNIFVEWLMSRSSTKASWSLFVCDTGESHL